MFAIVWADEAFDQMGQLILRHPARRAEFAVALRQLADLIQVSPAEAGESREGIDHRVLIVKPLTVYYEVDEESRTVEVAQIVLTQ